MWGYANVLKIVDAELKTKFLRSKFSGDILDSTLHLPKNLQFF
jgi:hypothetical protein